MKWNNDMEAAPTDRPLLVQWEDRVRLIEPDWDRRMWIANCVAWAEIEPYVPEKPKQIRPSDPMWSIASQASIVRQIEQRTREIVDWENEYDR